MSFNPAISPDGSRVAFVSQATDLVSLTDGNQQTDVYLRDINANSTFAISWNSTGTAMGNAGSSTPIFSADGENVLFISIATDLASGDSNGKQDIFLWNRVSQTNELISVNAAGNGTGSGASGLTAACVSDSLRYVAFFSDAPDLVAGNADSNGVSDVFVRDRVDGVTRLISFNPDSDVLGNGASFSPFVSAAGDVIVFATDASNLGTNDLNSATDIVATALTNDVPASMTLSAMIFLPREIPQGVEFPITIEVANFGSATIANLRVAHLGSAMLSRVGLQTTQGNIDPAGERGG